MMNRIYFAVLALLGIFVWVASNPVVAMSESGYSPGRKETRRLRPDVVVGHDMGGKAVTADAVAQPIEVAADSSDAQKTIWEKSEDGGGSALGQNIALGKPTAASSLENASNRTGAQAVDGRKDTRWASEHSDSQWIQIDLGSEHHITAAVLEWEVAYASVYELRVSDNGTTWTTIFRTTSGGGGLEIIRGLSGTGRYIRMYGEQRATRWGISLWEFEVYGTPAEGLNTEPVAPFELQISHKSQLEAVISG